MSVMMLSLILAATVAAAPAPTPASTAIAAPVNETEARIAELNQLYDQSCRQRAYGQYDDVCENLRRQIKDAEAEARKSKPAAASAKPDLNRARN